MCVVRLLSSLPRRVRLCVFCNSVFCWGLGPIHCCIFGFRPYLIIFSFFVVGSFLAFLVVLVGSMPPKSKRKVEGKSEEAGGDDGDLRTQLVLLCQWLPQLLHCLVPLSQLSIWKGLLKLIEGQWKLCLLPYHLL